MVLRLWRALPGVRALLVAVTLRNTSQRLIPASGDQDHTLLPTARRIIRQVMPLASIAARPTSVTTRTPLRSRRDAWRQPYFSV